MKKGISAIVSTVLLVILVIGLGIIIMSWGGGLINKSIETSEGKIGTELECDDVELKLEKSNDKIIIKNNGEKEIYGYIVRRIIGDNVEVDENEKNTKIKIYGAEVYEYGSIDKIEIIPRIEVNDAIVDCVNQIKVYTF